MILRICTLESTRPRPLEKQLPFLLLYAVYTGLLLLLGANCARTAAHSSRKSATSLIDIDSVACDDEDGGDANETSWQELVAQASDAVNLSSYSSVLHVFCVAPLQQQLQLQLPFCNYNVASTLRGDECTLGLGQTCSACLQDRVLRHDLSAAIEYQRFTAVLDNYDCGHGEHDEGDDEYDEQDIWSNKLFTCAQCAASYKEWLCSVKLRVYVNAVWLPPCASICRKVAETCPFFVPEFDDGSGEPLFFCSADDANFDNKYFRKEHCYTNETLEIAVLSSQPADCDPKCNDD